MEITTRITGGFGQIHAPTLNLKELAQATSNLPKRGLSYHFLKNESRKHREWRRSCAQPPQYPAHQNMQWWSNIDSGCNLIIRWINVTNPHAHLKYASVLCSPVQLTLHEVGGNPPPDVEAFLVLGTELTVTLYKAGVIAKI